MKHLPWIVGLVCLSSVTAANAVIIDGADLAADPRVGLPTGDSGTVGTSVQFAGGAGNRVLIDVDLSAFGFGTGPGQSTSGSVAVTTTRITADSDFWFGLWDGSNFTSVNFWDGDRVNGVGYGSSDGTSHSSPSGGTTSPLSVVQAIGDTVTSVISFDLIGDAISLVVNGTSVSGGLGSLNTAANLSFLVGKGSVGETHQIDTIEIRGGTDGGGGSVPIPATLALVGLGLAAFGFGNRRSPN